MAVPHCCLELKRTGAVSSVAFSPDGTKLAFAGNDGTVRLRDVSTTRQSIGEPLSGHNYAVSSVAFSPDGTVLASAGNDGTVRLWDVSARKPIVDALGGHTDAVYAVAFSPDGTKLASAGFDGSGYNGTVRLWDCLWDVGDGCALAAPYVTRAQVQRYGRSGWEPRCQYAD